MGIEYIDHEHKDDLDFIQKNGAWLLSVVGAVAACLGVVFTYFLKSRCKTVNMGCIKCDREVLELEGKDSNVVSST